MQIEIDRCNKILSLGHTAAVKYYDEISSVVSKLNPSNTYLDSINAINITLEVPTTLSSYVELFDLIDKITANFSVLKSMVLNTEYQRAALHSKSATYTLNVNSHKNAVLTCSDEWNNIDLDVFTNITATTEQVIDIASTHMNYFVVAMMKKVKYTKELSVHIEKYKDKILNSTRIDNSEGVGAQSTIVRGGLVPTHTIKSYDELVSIASNGPNIILMRNGCTNPVIFNMSGLIDHDYIISNDLATSRYAGLNKKVLQRYQTTKIGQDTAPNRIEILKGVDAMYLVYENISGDEFRLLKLHNDTELLTENQVKFVFSISGRPKSYHEKSYVDVVDDKYSRKVDKYMSTHINISPDIIKRLIYEKIMAWYASISDSITSNDSFHQQAVVADTLNEIIIDVLTSETELYSDYRDPEVWCSHVVKFDSICREFVQLAEKNLSKITIPSRIFVEESKNTVYEIIKGYINDIYKPAIEDIGDRWADFEVGVKESFSKY